MSWVGGEQEVSGEWPCNGNCVKEKMFTPRLWLTVAVALFGVVSTSVFGTSSFCHVWEDVGGMECGKCHSYRYLFNGTCVSECPNGYMKRDAYVDFGKRRASIGAACQKVIRGTIQAWGDETFGGKLTDLMQLNNADIVGVFHCYSGFAILKENGDVHAWGQNGYNFENVPLSTNGTTAIYATQHAFAAVHGALHDVTVWGSNGGGYNSGARTETTWVAKPPGLNDVATIFSAESSFCALKYDGTLDVWGQRNHGGCIQDALSGAANGWTCLPASISSVTVVESTAKAYAALRTNGTVVAWGTWSHGGCDEEEGGGATDSSYTCKPSNLQNVSALYSTLSAFAALRIDGTVVSWGLKIGGGCRTGSYASTTCMPAGLQNVRTIFANDHAFVAVQDNGLFVGFGKVDSGATVHSFLTSLPVTPVKELVGVGTKFASLNRDGTVYSWGQSMSYYQSSVASYTNVVQLVATGVGFAALRSDGDAKCWPAGSYGGNCPAATTSGKMTELWTTYGSVVGFTSAGVNDTLFGWGQVQHNVAVTSVYAVYATYGAFLALRDACPSGKYKTARHGMTCSTCPPGTMYSNMDFYSCPNCPVGRYSAIPGLTDVCRICLPGTYQDTPGSTSCLSCPAGRYLEDSGEQTDSLRVLLHQNLSNCALCPPGRSVPVEKASFAANCLTCVTGKYAPAPGGHAFCKSCEKGRYLKDDGVSAEEHDSKLDCKLCSAGSYTEREASSVCVDCARGRYGACVNRGTASNASQSVNCSDPSIDPMPVCLSCVAGYYGDEYGAATCKHCAIGLSSQEGDVGCFACRSGEYLNTSVQPGICHPCASGTYSEIGSAECTLCTKGRWTADSRSCISCIEGKYGIAIGSTSNATCIDCPRGFYGNAKGADSSSLCNPCPPGKYSDTTGASSSTACVACMAGSFCKGGSARPKLCSPGHFSQASQAYCTGCELGHFAAAAGLHACQICPQGRYQDAKAEIRCVPCPADSYAATFGNVAKSQCSPCTDYALNTVTGNNVGAVSASSCVCTVGYFRNPKGEGEHCLPCPTPGARCGENNVTKESIETLPGYWRASHASEVFYPCKTVQDCPGGFANVTVDAQCFQNHAGPLCTLCADGHARINGECEVCPNLKVAPYGIVLMFLISAVLLGGYYVFHFSPFLHLGREARVGKGFNSFDLARKKRNSFGPKPPSSTEMTRAERLRQATRLLIKVISERMIVSRRVVYTNGDAPHRTVDKDTGNDTAVRLGLQNETCAKQGEGSTVEEKSNDADEISREAADTKLFATESGTEAVDATEAQDYLLDEHAFIKKPSVTIETSLKSKLRVIIGYMQVTSALHLTFGIQWPPVFQVFMDVMAVINLDLSHIWSAVSPCAFSTSFLTSFYMHMLALPVVTSLIYAAAYYAKSKWPRNYSDSMLHTTKSCVVFWVFLLYPGLGTKIFRVFKCTDLDGTMLLEADLGVKCWEGEHMQTVGFAIFFLLLYVVGIPLATTLLLYRRQRSSTLYHPDSIDIFGSLFLTYKGEYWYFETVEMIKKMILAGGLVLVAPGSSAQLLLGVLVALSFLVVLLDWHPYEESGNNRLQALVTVQILVNLLFGMIMRLDVADEGKYEADTIGTLLVLMNMVVLAVAGYCVYIPTVEVQQELMEIAAIFYQFYVKEAWTKKPDSKPDAAVDIDHSRSIRPPPESTVETTYIVPINEEKADEDALPCETHDEPPSFIATDMDTVSSEPITDNTPLPLGPAVMEVDEDDADAMFLGLNAELID